MQDASNRWAAVAKSGAICVLMTGCALKLTAPGGSTGVSSSSSRTSMEINDPALTKKLDAGCTTDAQCQELIDEAQRRYDECAGIGLYSARCYSFRQPELTRAKKLLAALHPPTYKVQIGGREFEGTREEIQEAREAERKAKRAAAEQAERDEREARQRARQEQREAKEAAVAAVREAAAKPEFAIPVLSARICKSKDTLALLKDDLRREKRITRESGVMDLANRRAIVETMDTERADIKRYKRVLRTEFNASPRSCNGQVHKRILECQAGFHPSTYTAEEQRSIQQGNATHDELFARHVHEQRCEEPFGTYVDILDAGIYR